MATRVNTKFVILLAACIVALVGAIGAFYVLKVARSADQLAREGAEYLQNGEIRLAMEKYGRAVGKEPNNLELLEIYGDLVQRVPAKDYLEAQKFLGQSIEAKRQMSEAAPDDDALLENLYSHVLRLADEFGGRQFIDQLDRLTTARLEAYSDEPVAAKYHAIAQVRQMTEQTAREEIETASNRLLAALEADPNDVQASRHLALWMLFEAGRLTRINAPQDQIDGLRAQAMELSKRMVKAHPDDLQAKLYRLELMLHPNFGQVENPETKRPEPRHLAEAGELATQVEAALLEKPEPSMAVVRLAELLPTVDRVEAPAEGSPQRNVTKGVLRAERLIEAAAAREPDSVLFNTMLGRLAQMQGRDEEAAAHFATSWKSQPELPAEPMLRAHELRITSGISYAGLLVGEADAAADPAQREAKLVQAEGILKEIQTLIGETGHVRLTRGKIALARRQWIQAMQHLDKAAEELQGSQQEAEATLLSARARQLSGEPGAAAEQLERVAERFPQATQLRLQLAEIYNQSRQFDRAQQHLQVVLALEPQNIDAAKLQAQALALQNKPQEAIAAFERLDVAEHPEIAAPLAALYLSQNQPERARELLEPRFAAQPKDVRVLAALLRATPDAAARQALLARAREAGADEQAVRVLELQVQAQAGGGTLSQQELIEQFVEAQEDPTRRAMTEARLAAAQGDLEKAEAVLAAAEKANPAFAGEAGVVEMRFDLALQQQDWPKAEALAVRGQALNLDLAGGAFFQGRLAVARGNLTEAAGHYRRGLAARPVFSEGWRRLGEVQAQIGDRAGASDSFRKAIEQRPDNVRAIKGLASVADAEGERMRALQVLRDALPVAGNDAELVHAYLQYEAQYGDKAKALAMRRELAERNPDNAANQREIALLLASMDKSDEALAMLQAQAAEHGQTLETAMATAQVHAAADNVEAGDRVLSSYVESKGSSATIEDHVALGRFRLVSGNLEGAVAAYEAARAMEDAEVRPVTRELADMLFARGANEQALPLYRELFAKDQADPVVGLRLAETLLRLGQIDAAKPILEQFAGRVESKLLQALVRRADADAARGEGRDDDAAKLQAEAIALFEEAVRTDEENGLARVQLALALRDDPASAGRVRQLLDEALRINPQLADARLALVDLHLRGGRANDAIREMRVLVDQQPSNAQHRGRLAQLYLQNGDPASAELTLREGAKLDPENAVYPQMLGQIALQSGDRGKALESAKQAFDLAKTPDNLLRYASLLIEEGQAEQADQVLEENIDLVNEVPLLQGIRGLALAKSGRTDEAKALFTRAVQRAGSLQHLSGIARQMVGALGPDAALAHLAATPEANPLMLGLVAAEMELSEGKFSAAAQRLEGVVAQVSPGEPLWAQAQSMLGMALYQAEDFEGAAKAYTALLERFPDDVATLNNLAYLYVEDLQRPEEGLPLAERAARLQPDNEQVLDTLGWAQYKAKRPEDAAATLRRSVESGPLAPNHYHLAVVLKDLGPIAQAREHANEAIRLAELTGDESTLQQARNLLQQLSE